ncbi:MULTISPECIES: type II toxin-antitoxin system RelE/ParE family toxin [Avibacterium]|uniref:Type II toxin-antitoxin system RelE/ParE family toxin n=1 Tax=Avibacterium paragallinarum TaxID=728 RepID=A0ABU7QN38_AVIPA|nr:MULTISPECIES: type II toxin-antitoxin system RelE/ParE family toxin [Avibacterium]MCW9714718.1 type II toxin-antitoxin system RelE/ParE family toxin [Avibacterium sp. 21-594]
MPVKPMRISPSAMSNMQEIFDSVADYTGSVKSVKKLQTEFFRTFEQLSRIPKSGKQIGNGRRQVFCRHYRIVYREYDDRVEIITVIHSRRKYPLLSS